jgi:hypothetical protein
MAEPVRVPGRVQQADPAAGRVPQQVHPVQSEVAAQRLDILDKPVDPVRHGILRCLRRARAAVVQQDQRPLTAKTTQVSEILGSLAGTAGNAHQGRPGASHSVGQFRAVPGAEAPHTPHLT